MSLALVALVIGGVIGLAGGGRVRYVTYWPLRAWWLLVAGCVLQILAAHVDWGWAGTGILVLGYACLLGFCAANWTLGGMGIAALGLLANAAVITVNGGMPVRTSTLVSTHMIRPAQVASLRFDHRHHPERASTQLAALGDIIPVRPLHQLVSFGDLVLAVGAADVAGNLVRPRRGRHWVGRAGLEPVPATRSWATRPGWLPHRGAHAAPRSRRVRATTGVAGLVMAAQPAVARRRATSAAADLARRTASGTVGLARRAPRWGRVPSWRGRLRRWLPTAGTPTRPADSRSDPPGPQPSPSSRSD